MEKNTIFSHWFRFTGVPGGGDHHVACFSGSMLLILRNKGDEERQASGRGYYQFADPTTLLTVCHSGNERESI
ncbi:MAG: hypothetical protein ACRYFU_13125, partial [Janthinobacterium lividum]